jgi:hypothetical protein
LVLRCRGQALGVLGEACGFFFADALEFFGYALLDLEFEVALAG